MVDGSVLYDVRDHRIETLEGDIDVSVERDDDYRLADGYTVPTHWVRAQRNLFGEEVKYIDAAVFLRADPQFWHEKHVVDFGCGDDRGARALVDLVGESGSYHGIDINPITPIYPYHYSAASHVHFHRGVDITTLDPGLFQPEQFDVSLFLKINSFSLDTTRKLLKPNGVLIFSDRFYRPEPYGYTLSDVSDLRAAGFTLHQIIKQHVDDSANGSREIYFVFSNDL